MKTCKGCAALVVEAWPKGCMAAICGDPPEKMKLTAGGRRTLHVFGQKKTGAVIRPAWCERKDKI